VFTIIQSIALQYKPLRRSLGILDQPDKAKLPSMMESWEYVIKGFQNKVADAKAMEAHKINRAQASEQMKRFEEARRR
jgi:YidC/Oxa1 family membrane protein insertase